MSDDEIVSLAHEIDDMLMALVTKYNSSHLVVSSIILARLVRINDYTQDSIEFKKILKDALSFNGTERVTH